MGEISQFRFPTDIRFGPGSRSALADFAQDFNVTRPLIVTDSGLVETDAFKLVIQQADTVWPDGYAKFTGVHPNPSDEDVENAWKAYAGGKCDGVIGLGGGSAIDAAKAMLLKTAFPDTTLSEIPFDKLPAELAPFCAISTTAGTGSEVGRSAVITIKAENRKGVFGGPPLMPKMAILDPELTIGLPAHLTAATGMDALVHAIEAYVCPVLHPMCDGIALEAIRLVHDYLPKAYADGTDIHARGMMQLAASMGAVAFQKDLGAVHSMAHPLSTICNVQHGLANAVCLVTVIKFNKDVCADRYARIAQCFNINTFELTDAEATDKLVEAIEQLNNRIGIPATLAEVGVREDQLEQLADDAFKDPCHPANPRSCTREDFLALYKEAYGK